MKREDSTEPGFGADEQFVIDRLREAPGEQASPEARERAREAFLTGEGEPLALRPRLSVYQRWGGPLAAAAILVLVLIGYGLQPDQHWRVTDVKNPDGVTGIEGGAELGATFASGHVITAADAEVELQLGDDLQIRLIPDTDVELPAGPGRWFGSARTLRLLAGEIYGTSGGEELGWRLTLAGRDAEALLTGTTFAVFLLEEATCFCLFEGGLEVRVSATGERLDLPVGQRIWVYPDGRTEIRPLGAMETMKLEMARDRGIRPAR